MPKQTKKSLWRRLIAYWPFVVTPGLIATAFTWYPLSWLILVAMVPLFWLIGRSQLELSRRKFILLVWLSGLVSYLLILVWVVQTDPSQWANVNGTAVMAAHTFAWFLFAVTHSLAWLVFGAIAARFRGRTVCTPWAAIVLPSAFVAGEFIRAVVTSIAFWGAEGLVGPYWNFGSLGFAASGTSLVFSARWVGLAGLTFLVVLINLALYWLLTRYWRLALIGLGSAALLTLSGYLLYRTPDGIKTNVGIMHITTEQSVADSAIRAYADSHPAPRDLDVMVLPEYSGLYTGASTVGTQDALGQFAFGGRPGLVIAAGYGTREGERVGQIGYYVNGQPISLQEKQFLMPAGEYLPASISGVIQASGSPVLLPRFNAARRVSPARQPEKPVTYQDRTYGTLSCSGVLTPHFYRRLASQGAEILVNPTSLIIFEDSASLTNQNEQMARYQAVANARPFVQSARGARSYVIDQNGRFLLTSDGEFVIDRATITSNKRKTPYTVLGEWVPWAAAIILLAYVGRRLRTTRTG